MRTSIALFLTCTVVIAGAAGLTAQTKKYDIKSGIVTFETITVMGDIRLQEKSIVYFDEYGMKECKESYEGNTVKEVFFSDGKTLYALNRKDKVVYNRGSAYRGTELKFDWNEVSKKDKAKGKAKQLPNVTIAGKSCESFVVTSSSGKTVFAGWKGICLLTDLTSSGMHVVSKAVTIDENATVPPEKFTIPAGYKIQ